MRFTIYQEPIAKGRPKVAVRGKFATVYTPKETRAAELRFQEEAKKYAPDSPMEGPLVVYLDFYKVKPKSYPKGVNHWTKKPDIDNMAKLVLDAMSKIFYVDDSQVVELNISKQYGDIAKIVINVNVIDDDED